MSKILRLNTKKFLREKLGKDIGLGICNFSSEMVENRRTDKSLFSGLCNTLLIDLVQDHQQHPAVHSGGFSRGRVLGCGCCRYWHLTGDRWHMTCDTGHVTPDISQQQKMYWCYYMHTYNICFSMQCKASRAQTAEPLEASKCLSKLGLTILFVLLNIFLACL